MGKYMRKAKAAGDPSQSSLGVWTRAKTLALQRLQKSAVVAATSGGGGSYLQLRSRRLAKPPIRDLKREKQTPKENCVQNPNPNSNSAGSVNCDREGVRLEREEAVGAEEENREKENGNAEEEEGMEASFGENVLEFEGRERGTRESTPCSLIRDPESIRTPGSTTRPTSSADANRTLLNSMRRHIPTTNEMDEFFAGAEEQQQKQFIDKYNFDPANDAPLPGRYEWAKLDP